MNLKLTLANDSFLEAETVPNRAPTMLYISQKKIGTEGCQLKESKVYLGAKTDSELAKNPGRASPLFPGFGKCIFPCEQKKTGILLIFDSYKTVFPSNLVLAGNTFRKSQPCDTPKNCYVFPQLKVKL